MSRLRIDRISGLIIGVILAAALVAGLAGEARGIGDPTAPGVAPGRLPDLSSGELGGPPFQQLFQPLGGLEPLSPSRP